MRSASVDGVQLSWDEATRLLTVVYAVETRATEATARMLIPLLDEWIGADSGPYRILVDAAGLRDATAGYRSRFSQYFRRDRDRVRMALFNVSPLVRVLLVLFAKATSTTARAFATEAEARTWLGAPPSHVGAKAVLLALV